MSSNHIGTSLKRSRVDFDYDAQNVEQSKHHLFNIPSADIIRLILAHLTECGLHESTRVLQQESGIGNAGSTFQSHDWVRYASTGQWGIILQQLSRIDKHRIHHPSEYVTNIIAAVHEITILELAEIGEWETAFTMFRLLQQDDEMSSCKSEITTNSTATGTTNNVTISRSLEQKLAHLMAERDQDPKCNVPIDYYGRNNDKNNKNKNEAPSQKQIRRNQIGQQLQSIIPTQPSQRLITLLQQAIQWQSYTGQIPYVRQMFLEENTTTMDNDNDEVAVQPDDDEIVKKKKKRTRKEFDLVLGEVTVDETVVGSSSIKEQSLKGGGGGDGGGKPISGSDYATIKLGKNTTAEVICFLPDGTGIVTGSSDGFIEIWDYHNGQLRINDLQYQQNDELMGHDNSVITAIAIANDTVLLASGAQDGIVHIWRIDTGKCLRTISTTTTSSNNNDGNISITSGVACLCFSPDSSHILTGHQDGVCREFGLRTSRMLKEFRGHTSYITSCNYHLQQQQNSISTSNRNDYITEDLLQLWVITASGDGTVRIWDGKTMDTIAVFRPISVGLINTLSKVDTSIATIDIERFNQTTSNEGSPTIHTVLKLHTPRDTMIIVPRGQCAFLVDYSGRVIRKFIIENPPATKNQSDMDTCFVAATVNSTNRWLYMIRENGKCCTFDVLTGRLESTIDDFTKRCISSSSSTTSTTAAVNAEISYVAHHPTKNILAAFSNHKGQKRGKVVLWK